MFTSPVHRRPASEARELADPAVETPDEVVREGDEVDVMLLGIDLERRRISLSLKQAVAAIGRDAP